MSKMEPIDSKTNYWNKIYIIKMQRLSLIRIVMPDEIISVRNYVKKNIYQDNIYFLIIIFN